MVNGAIGMAFFTAIKLFLMIGMTRFFPQKTDDPEQGDVCFDEEKNCWVIYNGEEWIEITKKEYFGCDTW
tara:strand:- start:24583 stop:24792 length:210 start_codon:yes stop_codon:yes gene_type:complete